MSLVQRICAIGLGAAAVLWLGVAAWAYWANLGGGGATVSTGTLNAPTNVGASAPADGSVVGVSWTGSTLAGGPAATGYVVTRIRTTDSAAFPACGTSLGAPTTSLACNDTA